MKPSKLNRKSPARQSSPAARTARKPKPAGKARTTTSAEPASQPPGVKPASPGRVVPTAASQPIPLYVISDSTGNLPRHMVSAFLTQFPPGSFEIRLRPFVDSVERLEAGFAGLTTRQAVVLHAVVDPTMKHRIAQLCHDRSFPCCDLTGSFVQFLSQASGIQPRADLASLHHLDAAYERRVAAMEYTLEHDDGLGLSTLQEADVVLTGISRTSKTPTSIYLALEGFKTANVSLAMQVLPPAELLEMPKERVAALIIDPVRLSEIRLRRNHDWNMSSTDYDRLDVVRKEVAWCRRLFASRGWAVFDITGQAIEETAARIVHKLGLRRR